MPALPAPERAISRAGFEPESGMYYERLGDAGDRPPWVLIHGGGGTGAVFRVTVDGRAGWADALVSAGHEVWLADWPGMGRSGSVDALRIGFDEVVDAFVRLVRDVVGRPVLLLGHSMGSAVAWRVAELARPLVSGVVGVAPTSPGNLQTPAERVRESGGEVVLRQPESGAEIAVSLDRLFVTPDEYVVGEWVEPSSRLSAHHADDLRRTIVPMPPRLVLQRLGADGGVPAVLDTSAYKGLWIRVVAATNDPTHSAEASEALAELFRSWGADARLVALGERGVEGNGHFMLSEQNSDEVLEVILDEAAQLIG